MFRKNNIIAEIFVKNFFENGHNLFAIVWEESGYYWVQFGHISKKYKKKINALKKFNEYLNNSLEYYDNGANHGC